MESGLLVLVIFAAFSLFLFTLYHAVKRIYVGPLHVRTPKPGERWVRYDKRAGPWPVDSPVVVTGVLDGWVRFDGGAFEDARLSLDWFRRMYRPVSAEMDNASFSRGPSGPSAGSDS